MAFVRLSVVRNSEFLLPGHVWHVASACDHQLSVLELVVLQLLVKLVDERDGRIVVDSCQLFRLGQCESSVPAVESLGSCLCQSLPESPELFLDVHDLVPEKQGAWGRQLEVDEEVSHMPVASFLHFGHLVSVLDRVELLLLFECEADGVVVSEASFPVLRLGQVEDVVDHVLSVGEPCFRP